MSAPAGGSGQLPRTRRLGSRDRVDVWNVGTLEGTLGPGQAAKLRVGNRGILPEDGDALQIPPFRL